MSKAASLDPALRESHYLAQTGRLDLTPAQRRRLRHKSNEALRVEGRHGRLRRRFDAKDAREVRADSRMRVATILGRIRFARFGQKYTTEQKAARRTARRFVAYDDHQRDLQKQAQRRNRKRAS